MEAVIRSSPGTDHLSPSRAAPKDEDEKPLIDKATRSPTSEMGVPPDENLPEVVTEEDASPQPISHTEEAYKKRELAEPHMYAVADESPMIPAAGYGQLAAQRNVAHMATLNRDGTSPWERNIGSGGSPGATLGHQGTMQSMTGRHGLPDYGPDGELGPNAGGVGGSNRVNDPRRILGVPSRTFYLGMLIAVLIVAGAVGGGIGGGLAASHAREQNSLPSATQNTSQTATSTGAVTSPTPSFLNNQTGPVGFAFQGFQEPQYLGNATRVIREEGFHDFGMAVNSYVWLPNGTSCCVTFCADQFNATGWRCQQWRREKASGSFPRVYIWCNQDVSVKANETCS